MFNFFIQNEEQKNLKSKKKQREKFLKKKRGFIKDFNKNHLKIFSSFLNKIKFIYFQRFLLFLYRKFNTPTTQLSFSLVVQYQGSTTIELSYFDEIFSFNYNKDLTCTIKEQIVTNRLKYIKWFINKVQIKASNDMYELKNNNMTLSLIDLKGEHTGVYYCTFNYNKDMTIVKTKNFHFNGSLELFSMRFFVAYSLINFAYLLSSISDLLENNQLLHAAVDASVCFRCCAQCVQLRD